MRPETITCACGRVQAVSKGGSVPSRCAVCAKQRHTDRGSDRRRAKAAANHVEKKPLDLVLCHDCAEPLPNQAQARFHAKTQTILRCRPCYHKAKSKSPELFRTLLQPVPCADCGKDLGAIGRYRLKTQKIVRCADCHKKAPREKQKRRRNDAFCCKCGKKLSRDATHTREIELRRGKPAMCKECHYLRGSKAVVKCSDCGDAVSAASNTKKRIEQRGGRLAVCIKCARRNSRRAMSERPGRVYFVEAVGGGRIKIGFSSQVSDRKQGLVTAALGYPLETLLEIEGSPIVENEMHRRFAPFHIEDGGGTEWFEANDVIRFYCEVRREPYG
jgi:hypothetical protein